MRLFLECKPDEVLARVAGVPGNAIIHSPGKGKLSNLLAKCSGAVGMIDEDLGSAEPKLLNQFVEISFKHDLRVKEDRGRNNRLVIVCPRLEEWIIKSSKAVKVKMMSKDLNLSENAQELHADINQRLPNLERLLQRLLDLKSPRLLHLMSLLGP